MGKISETNDDQWGKLYSDWDAASLVRLGHLWGDKLHEASRSGDVEKVREIIAMPVETGGLLLMRYMSTDENGNNALHLTAQAG